jgi:hypothetical protein
LDCNKFDEVGDSSIEESRNRYLVTLYANSFLRKDAPLEQKTGKIHQAWLQDGNNALNQVVEALSKLSLVVEQQYQGQTDTLNKNTGHVDSTIDIDANGKFDIPKTDLLALQVCRYG